MKLIAATLVALTLPAVALAEPVNRYTITGRSAAAAVAQGVPLDQTPKPDAPSAVDAAIQDQAIRDQAMAPGGAVAAPADGSAPAAEPQRPRVVRSGLLGLSWRTEP